MKQKILIGLCLLIILAHAGYVRRYAPWLSHWKGDQNHYVALGMKLDRYGLDGYSLRGVRFRSTVVSESPRVAFTKAESTVSRDETGDLVRVLTMVGQTYYDEPLHMRAPLFAWMVRLSNQLWAKPGFEFALESQHLGERVKDFQPAIVAEVQRWAVNLSLMGNFLVLILVFFAGRMWFGNRAALYATFLMATNPIHITSGYRLLADDWTLVWLLGSMMLAYRAVTKQDLGNFFAAGVLLGLGFLTKQTVVIVAGGVLVFAWLVAPRRFFWKGIPLYVIGIGCVTAFWLIKVWQVYGHPLHQPVRELMIRSIHEDISGWFRVVYAQMHPWLLFSVGLLYLSPLMVVAYGTLGKCRDWMKDPRWIYLWIWILSFYIHFIAPWELFYFNGNREHRYFYPAYPAILILAGYSLDWFRYKISTRLPKAFMAEVVIWAFLILNASWSIRIAMSKVFQNDLFL